MAGNTAEKDAQFWPEVDVYYRLSSNARLFFLLAPVCEVEDGQRSDITETQFGAHFEVGLVPIGRAKRAPSRYDGERMKYLRCRAGLRYQSVPDDESATEWRVIGELTPRTMLPLDFILAFRNRLDLRWIDHEFSWRYRPRLWLERELPVGPHLSLVPYGSAEIFWASSSDGWTRTRYQVGTGVAVTPWFAPEVYWAHQSDDAPDGEMITDALGVVLAFYF